MARKSMTAEQLEAAANKATEAGNDAQAAILWAACADAHTRRAHQHHNAALWCLGRKAAAEVGQSTAAIPS